MGFATPCRGVSGDVGFGSFGPRGRSQWSIWGSQAQQPYATTHAKQDQAVYRREKHIPAAEYFVYQFMSLQRVFADSVYESRDGPACTLLIFPFSLGTQTKLFLSVPAAFLLIRMLERRVINVS